MPDTIVDLDQELLALDRDVAVITAHLDAYHVRRNELRVQIAERGRGCPH